MNNPSITLDASTFRDMVGQAMLASITGDQRDAILQKAVQALMTPADPGIYGRKPTTPLQDAFDAAASHQCRTWIEAELANPEGAFYKAVHKMLTDGVAAFVQKAEEQNSAISNKIVSAMQNALSNILRGE